MNPSDIVAIYGAALSTVLGLVQYHQWRMSKKFLAVRPLQIHYTDHTEVEVAINNRGQFPVTLDYVACGVSGVTWRSPWRRDCISLVSMAKVVEWAEDGAVTKGRVDGVVLSPGETIKAVAKKDVFLRLEKSSSLGFYWRNIPCVWIEHSQSDSAICKVINWD